MAKEGYDQREQESEPGDPPDRHPGSEAMDEKRRGENTGNEAQPGRYQMDENKREVPLIERFEKKDHEAGGQGNRKDTGKRDEKPLGC